MSATRFRREGRLFGTSFEPDYRFHDPKVDVFYDWMLAAFHQGNFSSRGLAHILRAMIFEAYADLEGATGDAVQRDELQYLTAVCNRLAFSTLRRAVEHIRARPWAG